MHVVFLRYYAYGIFDLFYSRHRDVFDACTLLPAQYGSFAFFFLRLITGWCVLTIFVVVWRQARESLQDKDRAMEETEYRIRELQERLQHARSQAG